MMKRILISVVLLFALSTCASVAEMSETGNPPKNWVNLYTAGVQIATKPKLIREPLNYLFGFISAATGGGMDLTIEDPASEE